MMLNVENEELNSSVELNGSVELSSGAESSCVTDDVLECSTDKHKVSGHLEGNFISSTEIPHGVNILPSCVYSSLDVILLICNIR